MGVWERDQRGQAAEEVERGEFARAYAMGEEAISLKPEAGEYRYHLACYYSRGGKKEEAIRMLGEALRREPSLAKQAATDTDLTPLHQDSRFGRMLEAATKGREPTEGPE
jgi:tetratricopeptide (TPR) repeat protein